MTFRGTTLIDFPLGGKPALCRITAAAALKRDAPG